jgi:hypothetical protein
MATAPKFYSTPRYAVGALTTGNTATDGTGTNAITILTGAATGTKIEEIFLKSGATNLARPADSCVRLFLIVATAWYDLTEIDMGAPAARSTTVTSYQSAPVTFENLILPDATFAIGATITVTPTAGSVLVHVMGNDG